MRNPPFQTSSKFAVKKTVLTPNRSGVMAIQKLAWISKIIPCGSHLRFHDCVEYTTSPEYHMGFS